MQRAFAPGGVEPAGADHPPRGSARTPGADPVQRRAGHRLAGRPTDLDVRRRPGDGLARAPAAGGRGRPRRLRGPRPRRRAGAGAGGLRPRLAALVDGLHVRRPGGGDVARRGHRLGMDAAARSPPRRGRRRARLLRRRRTRVFRGSGRAVRLRRRHHRVHHHPQRRHLGRRPGQRRPHPHRS